MKLTRTWIILLAILLVATFAAPAAFAQGGGGRDSDRLVFGRDFTLAAGEDVVGNVVVLGGSAAIESGSVVRGDVAVFGGDVTIFGTVEGNVAVFGGALTLEASAIVEGDVASLGGSVERRPGAAVSGQIFEGAQLFPPRAEFGFERPVAPAAPPRPESDGPFDFLRALIGWQVATVGWTLLVVLLGVVALAVAPRAFGRMASAAADEPLTSFGMGLLTLAVGLGVGLVLLIACCLGVFVWLALVVAWLVGWIAVGLWLGQRILQGLHVRNATAFGEVALGLALITLLSRIPACIGFLFSVVVGCIGLGAVVLTRFGTQPAQANWRGPAHDDQMRASADMDALVLPFVDLPALQPEPVPFAAPEVEPAADVQQAHHEPDSAGEQSEPDLAGGSGPDKG